ncbi:MAG: ABC transporter permease, partial [Anaerolineae bacterium]|nr:ABC transporter permease [Anaerolineae bacterium]
MRLLTPVLGRLSGVIGRMSARSVINSISRTAIAIASLLVAVSVIIGLQSMIGSFRLTVQSWLDSSLLADIYIGPPPAGVNDSESSVDAGVVAQFQRMPEVSEVTLFRRLAVEAALTPDPSPLGR